MQVLPEGTKMNCKRVKELIMTDYRDGEGSESVRKQIVSHLSACTDCRVYEQTVRQNADRLFKDLDPVQPPEAVWHNIREAVNEDRSQAAPSFLERVFDFVRESFVVRKPAYAFATVFTVILVTVFYWGSPVRQHMLVKDYLSQKSAFMVALNDAPNGELDKVANFNTAIEQYLF
jgi:predicted anti-sigma-YlaC factor YlaD